MKNRILSLLLALVMLFSLTSCFLFPDNQNGNGGTAQKTVYDTLGDLTKLSYSTVSVNVSTETDGIELFAEYILRQNTVEYKIEELCLLPEDGNISGVSPSYKTTVSGTAEVKNGQIIKLDGASVTLPSYETLVGAFNFDKQNFKNAEEPTSGVGIFRADVASPASFLGRSTSAKNMRVTVDFASDALKTVTLTYDTDLSSVSIVYQFQK